MGIFKNTFKNDEDTLSIINIKKATDEINTKTIELAKKLKSILVAIGCINHIIELNGEKFVVREIHDNTEMYYYIAILDKCEKEFYLDIDKPVRFYDHIYERDIIIFPTLFLANKIFLERAKGIFNEVKTIEEKHIKDCSNILEQVKDL